MTERTMKKRRMMVMGTLKVKMKAKHEYANDLFAVDVFGM